MNCELCQRDRDGVVVVLPIRQKNGVLCTMACLECAESSSAYCTDHQKPHMGFKGDDSTACMLCINETVQNNLQLEDSIFQKLQGELPPDELERLLKWAEFSAGITGNTKPTCILRAIVTKALRVNQNIQEVIEHIIESKSASFILPIASS